MKIDNALNMSQLIDAIGAGSPDPSTRGPVVRQINTWDGRTVIGSYHRCEKKELDISVRECIIIDDKLLLPFIQRLLDNGTPFITETGSHDMVCTLQWKFA